MYIASLYCSVSPSTSRILFGFFCSMLRILGTIENIRDSPPYELKIILTEYNSYSYGQYLDRQCSVGLRKNC